MVCNVDGGISEFESRVCSERGQQVWIGKFIGYTADKCNAKSQTIIDYYLPSCNAKTMRDTITYHVELQSHASTPVLPPPISDYKTPCPQ